jgi:hypothetical protein
MHPGTGSLKAIPYINTFGVFQPPDFHWSKPWTKTFAMFKQCLCNGDAPWDAHSLCVCKWTSVCERFLIKRESKGRLRNRTQTLRQAALQTSSTHVHTRRAHWLGMMDMDALMRSPLCPGQLGDCVRARHGGGGAVRRSLAALAATRVRQRPLDEGWWKAGGGRVCIWVPAASNHTPPLGPGQAVPTRLTEAQFRLGGGLDFTHRTPPLAGAGFAIIGGAVSSLLHLGTEGRRVRHCKRDTGVWAIRVGQRSRVDGVRVCKLVWDGGWWKWSIGAVSIQANNTHPGPRSKP